MSRLPGPDEQWVESTEGDLDPDLTEEWDWPDGTDDDYGSRTFWSPALMRIVMLLLIIALVVPAIVVTTR